MNSDLRARIRGLPGPILVIGASGFIGANLFRACLDERTDVYGTIFSGNAWRLTGLPTSNLIRLNLLDRIGVTALLARVSPATVFDCSAFGAYSFEQDSERIHLTNYLACVRLLEALRSCNIASYIHAGSSSEYGTNARRPHESADLYPNSHYSVSKASAAMAIAYYGRQLGLPVANLRLYSVYGPYEDSSRLIPVLCERSLHGELPVLASPETARDFVYIDDVVTAFVLAAAAMGPAVRGESFNIGTGVSTSLAELVELARHVLGVTATPVFDSRAGRDWDMVEWVAAPARAESVLGWRPSVHLGEGLVATRLWWEGFLHTREFAQLSKQFQCAPKRASVSAVVACYRDEPAIPILHQRLGDVFARAGVDYEIIFVNDGSPDNSAEVIRELSARDPRVIGITHSRNFGSQAAFRSGMEIASMEAVVLLDGDLQDPPELIEEFIARWRADDAEVVYGRRVDREMTAPMHALYKGFYRVLSALSDVPIPRDAGDFSLIDRDAVHWILQCQERDSFLRGLRAYVGFRQVAVDYVRSKRMFGSSTNNWIRNIGWAKKAIFSFSRTPLHLLTAAGAVACVITGVLVAIGLGIAVLRPELAPRGIALLALIQIFFSSFIILGLGLLGEYVGKILEETKARPAFIRKQIIRRGEIRSPTVPGGA
jgi:nucleoside-diphosphate-sugar epimerase/glycosyltransferase involved in cell wall biosynthesis